MSSGTLGHGRNPPPLSGDPHIARFHQLLTPQQDLPLLMGERDPLSGTQGRTHPLSVAPTNLTSTG
jgi:hypothetical protein